VFREAQESAIDGARLMMNQGIVLHRESSTEPVVSLHVEAFGERRLEDLIRNSAQ
jgi:phosphomannomutase